MLLFVLLCNLSFAQQNKRFYIALSPKHGKFLSGKLVGINDSGVVVSVKASHKTLVNQTILYTNINKIKIYNTKGGVLFGTITSLGVIGNVVAVFSIKNGLAAAAVGIGGSVAIVALATVIYNLSHPPVVKLVARNDQIDFNTVSTKFTPYIVSQEELNRR